MEFLLRNIFTDVSSLNKQILHVTLLRFQLAESILFKFKEDNAKREAVYLKFTFYIYVINYKMFQFSLKKCSVSILPTHYMNIV